VPLGSRLERCVQECDPAGFSRVFHEHRLTVENRGDALKLWKSITTGDVYSLLIRPLPLVLLRSQRTLLRALIMLDE
jgi:hypothetical protein